MSARDRWEYDVKCPSCHKTGSVKVSEDDYPFMSSPRFSVDEIPDGFMMQKQGVSAVDTVFVCSKCKVIAE